MIMSIGRVRLPTRAGVFRRRGDQLAQLDVFFTRRSRHTRCGRDWSSDVCSSDLLRLYPPGHPLVEETAEAAAGALTGFVKRVPVLTLGTSDGELVVNGQAADKKFFGDVGAFIVREIDRRELKSVTVSKGLTEVEVRDLVSLLAVAPQEEGAI